VETHLTILGYDNLFIVSDCNLNKDSYGGELGVHFEQSSLPNKFLAGEKYFQV